MIQQQMKNKLSNGGYSLTLSVTFATLPDLVDYYSRQCNGLCTTLKRLQDYRERQTKSKTINGYISVFC